MYYRISSTTTETRSFDLLRPKRRTSDFVFHPTDEALWHSQIALPWHHDGSAMQAPQRVHRRMDLPWTPHDPTVHAPRTRHGLNMDASMDTMPSTGPLQTAVGHHGRNNELWSNQHPQPNTAPWTYHGGSNHQPLPSHGGTINAPSTDNRPTMGRHGGVMAPSSTGPGGTTEVP